MEINKELLDNLFEQAKEKGVVKGEKYSYGNRQEAS